MSRSIDYDDGYARAIEDAVERLLCLAGDTDALDAAHRGIVAALDAIRRLTPPPRVEAGCTCGMKGGVCLCPGKVHGSGAKPAACKRCGGNRKIWTSEDGDSVEQSCPDCQGGA